MTEPQTPTGKRLLAEFDGRPGPLEPRRILAIEAEAARQERERLRALVLSVVDMDLDERRQLFGRDVRVVTVIIPAILAEPDSPENARILALLAEPEETP